MSEHFIKIIETSVIMTVYFIGIFVTKTIVNKTLKEAQLQRSRRKIIIKAIHLFTALGALTLTAIVWGVKQHQIAIFASTVLTAIGIAFFAQWSLLSNITSSIILFFNHPIKIGDRIKILDKDFPFEGDVSDLTYFFVHLITKDGEIITIPNSLLLQKSVAVIAREETT